MSTFLLYLLIIIPALWLGVLLAVYYFQESMIFHPEVLPSDHQYTFYGQDFEERWYDVSEKGRISAVMFKAQTQRRGVIYYHHGNAGSLQGWGERAAHFTKLGYDVLQYDYRSFGKSTGKIRSEKMLYRDAQFIYKELLKEYNESDVVVYGASLGTGVASRVAAKNFPRLVILETPYYNFYEVARFHYPYLPTSVLLKYRFNTNKTMPKIQVPVFLIHGTADQTVPYDNSVKLAALGKNVELLTLPGGLHNYLPTYPEYHEALRKIL